MPKKKKQPKSKLKDTRTPIQRARDAHAQANGSSKPGKPAKKKKAKITGKKQAKESGAERTAKGHFVKGVKHGLGGRPTAATEERLLTQLKKELTPEVWVTMLKAQIGKACNGDAKAFESICKYCLPTPEQRLKIENQQQVELRVAGIAPDQIEAMYVSKLLDKLRQQREQVTPN